MRTRYALDGPLASSAMTLRDRFYTPATAKAILSWRILLGLGVGVVVGAVGAPIWLAVVAGVATYAVSVALAMPRGSGGPRIDAFALGEPWRHYVHNARLAAGRMRAAVDSEGQLYVVDSAGGIGEGGRLQLLGNDGRVQWVMELDYLPGGVEVDEKRGFLWITNRTRSSLMKYRL